MATEQVDRTRLPIRRSVFKGVANRTLAGSKPDWDLLEHVTAARRRTQRAAGAHR